MLRSYWGIVVAVIGWLGLIAATQPNNLLPQREQGQPAAAELRAPSKVGVVSPTGESRDIGCEHGQDNRQSDLCAQWKAADSASDAAQWAWWQLVALPIGMAIGLGTLFFAGRAAHYAKLAASETKRAANAAENAIDETREIGRAQARCYVIVSDFTANIGTSDGSAVNLKLQNSGNSPAFAITVECELFGVFSGALRIGRQHATFTQFTYVVEPNCDPLLVEIPINGFYITDAERNVVANDAPCGISAEVRVKGFDVFKDPFDHTTKFVVFTKSKDMFSNPPVVFQRGALIQLPA